MIHPTDFDSSPDATVLPPPPVPESPSTNAWKVASVALGGLCLVIAIGWMHSANIAEDAQQQLRDSISSAERQRDAATSKMASLQTQFAGVARKAPVSIQEIAVLDDEHDAAPPEGFVGSELAKLIFSIRGSHLLCNGASGFKQRITMTVYRPDGMAVTLSDSPPGATFGLNAECSTTEGEWRAAESFGYANPEGFIPGTWRVIVTDRGAVVGRKEFDLK